MENTQLPEDFKDFLKLLNENEVQYLLIGGYAVGYYGYPRATHDMDIWIAVDPENAEKMIDVMIGFGFEKGALSKEVGCGSFRTGDSWLKPSWNLSST